MTWDWKTAYANKLITAEAAARLVTSNSSVAFGMASPINTPVALARALADRARDLRDVAVDATWSAAAAFLLEPETEASWRVRTLFAYNDIEHQLLGEHSPRVEFVPMHPAFLGALAGQSGREDLTTRYTGSDVYFV
jgi:acyl-CoA hydrolase